MKGDIVIIGGAGHIGLPLGLLFANKGKKVVLYDKDQNNIKKINDLKMPFMEDGGLKLLKKNKARIFATTDKRYIKGAKIIIVCIGTPVKKNKPNLVYFFKMFKEVKQYLNHKNLLKIQTNKRNSDKSFSIGYIYSNLLFSSYLKNILSSVSF